MYIKTKPKLKDSALNKHDDIDLLERFRRHSILDCDFFDADQETFDTITGVYLDCISLYGGSPEKAADALSLAMIESKNGIQHLMKGEYSFEASNGKLAWKQYCDTLKSLYFDQMIRLRWKRMRDHFKKTKQISRSLYQDYLKVLDVSVYVEFPQAFFAAQPQDL